MANPSKNANTWLQGLFFLRFGAIWAFFFWPHFMNIPFLDIDVIKQDSRLVLEYATASSAAIDLPALIDGSLMLMGGESKRIGARFKMHMKMRVAAIIAPRSSWGSRGLVISNTLGLIDADYQGEVMLTLLNRNSDPLIIQPGERIMQMFFIPILQARFTEVESFTEVTARGEGGFGSTGA